MAVGQPQIKGGQSDFSVFSPSCVLGHRIERLFGRQREDQKAITSLHNPSLTGHILSHLPQNES